MKQTKLGGHCIEHGGTTARCRTPMCVKKLKMVVTV